MSANTIPTRAELDQELTATGCRALVRYAPCRQTPCHLTAVLGNDFWWAKLHDLSLGGVGLLLDQPVEVGGFLFVELTNASRIFSRLLLTRVIHLTKHDTDAYLLGGEFVSELAAEELRLLLS